MNNTNDIKFLITYQAMSHAIARYFYLAYAATHVQFKSYNSLVLYSCVLLNVAVNANDYIQNTKTILTRKRKRCTKQYTNTSNTIKVTL